MASPVNTIGSAIATYINAGTYSQTFAAAYGYLHDKALADLTSYVVLVTPQDAELVQYTELRISERYSFQVVIAKKISSTTITTDMNAHMQLVDEIYRRLWPLQSDANSYDVQAVDIDPVYDGPRLREQCVAMSVIRVQVSYGGTV
jgi:hypothetical protein